MAVLLCPGSVFTPHSDSSDFLSLSLSLNSNFHTFFHRQLLLFSLYRLLFSRVFRAIRELPATGKVGLPALGFSTASDRHSKVTMLL